MKLLHRFLLKSHDLIGREHRCPHQQAWDQSSSNNTQFGISGMKIKCGAVVRLGSNQSIQLMKSISLLHDLYRFADYGHLATSEQFNNCYGAICCHCCCSKSPLLNCLERKPVSKHASKFSSWAPLQVYPPFSTFDEETNSWSGQCSFKGTVFKSKSLQVHVFTRKREFVPRALKGRAVSKGLKIKSLQAHVSTCKKVCAPNAERTGCV